VEDHQIPTGDSLEQLHTIPTHLTTVDTVLSLGTFALSSRQLLWLLVGGSLGATLWMRTGWLGSWLPPLGMLLHALVLLVLLIGVLALTFGQVQGRSLESWLLVIALYLARPRLSLWRSLRRQPAWPLSAGAWMGAGQQPHNREEGAKERMA